MAVTYSQIATQTLGSAAATVTFSSIPGTYTDLVLTFNGGLVTSNQDLVMRFNSDTGSNYSTTILRGQSGAASSARSSNATYIYIDWTGQPTDLTAASIIQVQNYSNSTTNKTTLIRQNAQSISTEANVGLWRSTSAITSITFLTTSGNILSGSTFTLYGIKAA